MTEHTERRSFVAELIDSYVGSWSTQAIMYLVIFALGATAGLVAEFRYRLPPQQLAPLVVAFTSLMVFVIPAFYVWVRRLRMQVPALKTVADPTAKVGETLIRWLPSSVEPSPWAGVLRTINLESTQWTDRSHLSSLILAANAELFARRRPFSAVSKDQAYDESIVITFLEAEFDRTKEWLLALHGPMPDREMADQLKKELDETFSFTFWFVIYTLRSTEERRPTVSFEEAVKTYSQALQEVRE